jgi:hypothetical protein
MFSTFSTLLDRGFIIGYFVPALVLTFTLLVMLHAFGIRVLSIDAIFDEPLASGSTFVFITFLASTCLVIFNYKITQFFEGYGRFNPLRLLKARQERRLRKLNERLRGYLPIGGTVSPTDDQEMLTRLAGKMSVVLREKARRFPQTPPILPTTLGNAIRAFEDYPRSVYGIDAIPGWIRLLAVIPLDYRKEIANAKSMMDLWINLCLSAVIAWLWYLLLISWIFVRDMSASIPSSSGLEQGIGWQVDLSIGIPILIAFALIAVGWLFYCAAIGAAIQFGEFVKASFDLYRADLCRKMGYILPASIEKEREFWANINNVMVLHQDEAAKLANNFRDSGKTYGIQLHRG